MALSMTDDNLNTFEYVNLTWIPISIYGQSSHFQLTFFAYSMCVLCLDRFHDVLQQV